MADFVLEIVEGPDAGRQVPLADRLELGRDASASVVLDDEEVSRHHARVAADKGGVTIEDLDSTNGTYVNDQPISGSRRLDPGDRIRVGLTVLELRSEQQVERQASVVEPAPEITQVGEKVLSRAAPEELAPVAEGAPNVPGFAVEESEPAFVPSAVAEAGPGAQPGGDGGNYDALARLVDTRVKHQTNVAAFAFLAIAGLAVLIFFGAR